MANKKISELDSRASLSLSDLLAVGDPTTGYLYKITITDLKSLTGAGVISFNGRVGAVSPAEGDYTLNQLGDAIITSPSNGQVLQYNGSNWVNAALPAEADTLNSVTTRGNTTTNGITVGSIVAGTTAAQAYHAFYSSNVNDGNTVTIAAENTSANSSRSQLLLTDTSGGASKRFGLGVYTGANPYSYLDAATKLVFQQSGGNVIVGGITDAGYKFDVVGTARIQGNLTLSENGGMITTNQFYGLASNYTNGIFAGWDTSAVYLGYQMGALPIEIGTNGTGQIRFRNTGGFKVESFAGTGSRILVADANGVITASSSALSGFVTLDTAQTITGAKTFTQTTAVTGNLLVRANSGNVGQALVLEYGTGGTGVNALTGVAMYANAIDKLDILFTNQGTSSRSARFVASSITNYATREYTLPDASGTLALTSDIPSLSNYVTTNTTQTITGDKTFNQVSFNNSPTFLAGSAAFFMGNAYLDKGISFSDTASPAIFSNAQAFYVNRDGTTSTIVVRRDNVGGSSYRQTLSFPNNAADRTYTFPDASGTLALTSNLSSYLPLTGGTLSGNLSIVKATGIANLTLDAATGSINELLFKVNGTSVGVMYVNGSFFQFNNYSTYGYLFKNAAGDNIFALQDAGSAFFISSVGATLFSAPTIQVSNATSSTSITSLATTSRSVVLPDAAGTLMLGSGTSGTHAKFTGTNAIGNSMLSDDGTTLTSAGATRSNLYLRAASTSHYGQIAFTNGSNGNFGGISYNNSGQYMQFETSSSEWMRLNSDGRFLINGTSASNFYRLQVFHGAAEAGILIKATNSGRYAPLSVITDTGSTHFTVLENGKVGINTSNPDNTYQGLTIFGSNPSLRLKSESTGSWNWIEFVNSSNVNNFSMGVSQSTPIFVIKAGAGLDNPHFALTTSGNVLIGTTSQSGMGSNGLKVRNNFWQLYTEKTHTSNVNYLNVNFNGYTGSAIVKVTHASYKAGVNTYSCIVTYYLTYNGVSLSVDTVSSTGAGSTSILSTSTAGGGSVSFGFVYMGGSNNWSNAAIEVQAVGNNISEQVVSVTLL